MGRILGQLLALVAFAYQLPVGPFAPASGEALRDGWRYRFNPPTDREVNDFFQEWASAKNWHTGRPIYWPQGEALAEYLGLAFPAEAIFIGYNAHPPSCVVLFLPFGALSYSEALVWWNTFSLLSITLSLVVVARSLGYRWQRWYAWWVLPLLAGVAALEPLRGQIGQGQINSLLLPLLVAGWFAVKRGFAGWAGLCIGLAALVKIFPAFLLLFLLLRRDYRGVLSGLLTIVLGNLLTMAVLGTSTYHDYATHVLPSLSQWRGFWGNHSVVGFWYHWFVRTEFDWLRPVVDRPPLAWGLIIGTTVLILTLVCRAVWTRPADVDRGYWLFVTAMLLLGPLTWIHSILLLTPGLFVFARDVWRQRKERPKLCWLLVGVVAYYGSELGTIINFLGPRGYLSPFVSLALTSLPCVVLGSVFVMQWHVLQTSNQE